MKKVFNKNQRIGIFIDTQNLYHSAKNNYSANVNYEEIVRVATAGRDLIRAFAYVVKAEKDYEEKFFTALEGMGIEIKVKELIVFHTGDKKADWDVGIAVDVIRMSDKLDTVVLVSGDSDFIDVVKYVQSRGVRAEVMAFGKTAAQKLVDEADYFFDLDSDPESFLLQSRYGSTYTRKTKNYSSTQHATGYSTAAYSAPKSRTTSNPPVGPSKVSENKNYDNLYQKNGRLVKPVVGKPVRANLYSKPSNVETKRPRISNAFGNSPEKKNLLTRKKKTGGDGSLSSSIFKF